MRNTKNENVTKHTKKREKTVKKPMEESYIIYYIKKKNVRKNKQKMSKKTCSAPRAWRRTHTNKSPLVSRYEAWGVGGRRRGRGSPYLELLHGRVSHHACRLLNSRRALGCRRHLLGGRCSCWHLGLPWHALPPCSCWQLHAYPGRGRSALG